MYIPGDHWIICDECGFRCRRSKSRKRWDGAIVCAKHWEPRHPQDFVRGRKDKQRVENPRPDTQNMHSQTTVKTGASKDDLTVDVSSTSGIVDGDGIGIVLDSGELQWTIANGAPSGDTVTLLERLLGDAAAGNVVYIPGDNFLATNEVTADSL